MKQNILIGITGGIAAYKIPQLVRGLQQEGCVVKIITTTSALAFVSKITLQVLGHKQLYTDENSSFLEHIELARWADKIIVAPLSANTLAKITYGLTDNLLLQTIMACRVKVYMFPAMNTQMWQNHILQKNIKKLKKNPQFKLVAPVKGELACGESGKGKMPDPDKIIKILLKKNQPLKGKKIIITAGATIEPIDAVRFISNHSSGKMAYSLANNATDMGADVLVIEARVDKNLTLNDRCKIIKVQTARQMYQKTMDNIKNTDIFIAVAAVADFSPIFVSEQKIKKTDENLLIECKRNIDILTEVASLADKPFCIGFAAETHNLEKNAKQKLVAKNIDMLVANNVANKDIGFNSDKNEVTIFSCNKQRKIPKDDKDKIATKILQEMQKLLNHKG
jgi:phosphopantothenoylcysteine decarboxylase / phosphopantothenate---cysteine ligase